MYTYIYHDASYVYHDAVVAATKHNTFWMPGFGVSLTVAVVFICDTLEPSPSINGRDKRMGVGQTRVV